MVNGLTREVRWPAGLDVSVKLQHAGGRACRRRRPQRVTVALAPSNGTCALPGHANERRPVWRRGRPGEPRWQNTSYWFGDTGPTWANVWALVGISDGNG